MMTRQIDHADRSRSRGPGLGTRLYPELSLVEDREERHRIFKTAERRLFSSWFAWVVALPVTLVVVLLLNELQQILQRTRFIAPWMAMLAFGAALLAYIAFVSTFVLVKPMRRSIREQLLEKGIPVCRRCGYPLRGLPEPRCPECGQNFDPALLG